MSVKTTDVFKQISLFDGLVEILAIGLDWMLIGPMALELLPQGFETVIEAWNELGYTVPLIFELVLHDIVAKLCVTKKPGVITWACVNVCVCGGLVSFTWNV